MQKMKKEVCLVLDNIRSAENVGAIFRTADACGVSKIFLLGVTPAPLDRFNRPRQDIAKAALGAEKTIEWEARANARSLIVALKRDGFEIIVLEQTESSVDYKKIKVGGKFALVLGNEVSGVSAATLRAADKIAEIPMLGEKESLNVSVATGVALFRLLNI